MSGHSISLQWTASGDDSTAGAATEYELRYSTASIQSEPSHTYSTASIPAIQDPGVREMFTLTELATDSTFYLSLRAGDEAGNWSEPSNEVIASTSPDSIPPAAITDLTCPSTSRTMLTLSWTATGDDSLTGQAAAYDLRRSSAPISMDTWGLATRVVVNSVPKSAGSTEEFLLQGLVAGTTYYLGIRVRDEGYTWSSLSNIVMATTATDTIPPATVSDLHVTEVTDSTTTLAWTAPGDNGTEGHASTYDIRFSRTAMIYAWDYAEQVEHGLEPAEPGSMEHLQIGRLDANTVYNFALRTADVAGNWSPRSNQATATTAADMIPPAVVDDLRGIDVTHSTVVLAWTAPGDDGTRGTAESYDLRYSRSPLTEINWTKATWIPYRPVPAPSGSVEQVEVLDLLAETTYYFRLRTQDESLNWSPLSNELVVTTAPDTVPPAGVTDLTVESTSSTSARLSWTAPGDDGNLGTATEYEIRQADTAITSQTWEQAQLVSFPPRPLTPGTAQSISIYSLQPESTYHFALKAADEKGNWATLSNVASVRLPAGVPTTWQVRADGTGDVPTIQAAIDTAQHGDTVLIHPGTYYENLYLHGKRIHLRSVDGPENTIVDGSRKAASVITCSSGEDQGTVIEGLTITGGTGTPWDGKTIGGGIHCSGASLTIINNVIRGNSTSAPAGKAHTPGGGLNIWSGAGVTRIEGNVIADNVSHSNGGGVYLSGEYIVVRHNIIRGNRSAQGGDGGGLKVSDVKQLLISDNVIEDNYAYDHGGGLYLGNGSACDIEVSHNVIKGNYAWGREGALDCTGGAIWVSDFGAHIHHNTIVFNDANKYVSGMSPIGGVCGSYVLGSTRVESNIIYGNSRGGIGACGWTREGTARTFMMYATDNIVFNNGEEDFATWTNREGNEVIIVSEGNLLVDPLLCVDSEDSMGEVASNSPALNQSFGVIGAIAIPGCGPREPSSPSAWDRIRGQYR